MLSYSLLLTGGLKPRQPFVGDQHVAVLSGALIRSNYYPRGMLALGIYLKVHETHKNLQ